VVVPDEKVERVVHAVIEANRTGQPGDGRIFVLPVAESVRVRTGERGDAALNED
jgi:nitrogen regulatory protein PII 2